MPIFLNFLLAKLLEFIFGDLVLKKEERVRKLVLDGEVPYILDPGLGRWLGLDQNVLGKRFEDIVFKVADH